MATTSRAGHPLPYDIYRQAIERETLTFAEAAGSADPGTAVPSCPDWSLADLTRHVGMLQRWFGGLLTALVQERPTTRDVEPGPDDARERAAWVAAGVPAVAAVLRDTDPGAPMWAWGEDQHARFWARRMLFETLVHRVDAERAVGQETGIDPVLAADGVDEFLVNLPYAGGFAPAVTQLRGTGETIAFRCADLGDAGDVEWRVRLDPDGLRSLPPTAADDAGTSEPHAAVSASAADLLLLLYGRQSYEEPGYEVTGDAALLDRWFAHTAF
ncbi:maleylpyruvate isomerase family mycothiol-dependent enzyme [Streptomyces olivochromogenes]|uniref:maleylpyruvate isomerase family mycothiol-dependent enzyme n=1 Tax=Streptomyces olivochromogenes TaxID=1963 RepID=UPI001F196258|nr:maleylpyruvate isomerase family mycothiol-dependent enzyme [Streptomyces olivochromogenes]MCF3131511.1 maleylpyruvate isomerase family mycothiol-dependent enzyme [Streptomyces olivochromogenes]